MHILFYYSKTSFESNIYYKEEPNEERINSTKTDNMYNTLINSQFAEEIALLSNDYQESLDDNGIYAKIIKDKKPLMP